MTVYKHARRKHANKSRAAALNSKSKNKNNNNNMDQLAPRKNPNLLLLCIDDAPDAIAAKIRLLRQMLSNVAEERTMLDSLLDGLERKKAHTQVMLDAVPTISDHAVQHYNKMLASMNLSINGARSGFKEVWAEQKDLLNQVYDRPTRAARCAAKKKSQHDEHP